MEDPCVVARNIAVGLTQAELLLGIVAGGMRADRARRNGQKPTFFKAGAEKLKTYYDVDIQSCLAEIAAAKVVRGYPLGLGDQKVSDVLAADGPWEVRHTPEDRGERNTHLIIRRRDLRDPEKERPDSPDKRFILVSGTDRAYVVHGWAWRDEVVVPGYRRKMKPDEDESWWMPVTDLREFEL